MDRAEVSTEKKPPSSILPQRQALSICCRFFQSFLSICTFTYEQAENIKYILHVFTQMVTFLLFLTQQSLLETFSHNSV